MHTSRNNASSRITGPLQGSLVFLLFLSYAMDASAQTLGVGTHVVDAPPVKVSVKRGWNLVTDAPTPSSCVLGSVSNPSFETSVEIGQFTDNSTLAKGFDLSAKAQARFLIGSADAEAKYVLDRQVTYENFSLAIRGRLRMSVSLTPDASPAGDTGPTKPFFSLVQPSSTATDESPIVMAHSIRLTPNALKLAKQNMNAFRTSCGDGFVVAVISGVDVVGIATTQTTDIQDQQKLRAALKGSILGQSAQVEVDQFIKELAKRSNTALTFQQFGGKPAELPVNADGLLAALKGMSASVANPNDAKDFQLLVVPYGPTTVANWPQPTAITSGPAGSPLDALMTRYWRYKSLFDQVDFIQQHLNDYVLGWGTTAETIAALKDEALKATQRLESAARACFAGEDCTMPDVAPDVYSLTVKLPLRKDWNPEYAELMAAHAAAAATITEYNQNAAKLRPFLEAVYNNGLRKDPTGYYRNHAFHESFSNNFFTGRIAPAVGRLRQAADQFADALVRDITEVRLRTVQRLRCQLSSLDEGCITEADISQLRSLIPLRRHGVTTNFTHNTAGPLNYPPAEDGWLRFQP